MTNRASRRANFKRRPKAMKLIEAQVDGQTADQLHARLVAAGIARKPPSDPAELYFVQCAVIRIAKVRRLPGGPDEALAAIEHEVREATGLGLPIFR